MGLHVGCVADVRLHNGHLDGFGVKANYVAHVGMHFGCFCGFQGQIEGLQDLFGAQVVVRLLSKQHYVGGISSLDQSMVVYLLIVG